VHSPDEAQAMLAILDWTNDSWLWLWWAVPLMAAFAAIVAIALVVTLTERTRS
jgi:hypothetical protein